MAGKVEDLVLAIPIKRPTLETLLPHAGTMCLLDTVTNWNENEIICKTWSHLNPSNPLRCKDGLSALQGIEYGAQAMAIHGTLLNDVRNGPARCGYLVAVRNLELFVDWLHDLDGSLRISATVEIDDDQFVVHRFTITENAKLLVSGRLNVHKSSG